VTWQPDPDALRGKVAVVAGATRGAGRGIACALGEAGATVVCTGRTSADGNARSDYDRNETIEETAEMVTRLGGRGIAAVVDHLDADQVRRLAMTLQHEFGHIDVLVNDIWGGEQIKGGPDIWGTPMWQLELEPNLRLLRLAIETHLVTSHALLPLLVDQPGGLVVEVGDGTTAYNATHYRISVFYDLAKVAVNRLAFSQGHEVAAFGATAVSLTPGFLRSEMMLEHFDVTEENWRDAVTVKHVAPEHFLLSESPRYVGRAVVALATDPERHRWNQQSVTAGDLAAEYGFTDVDGSQPQSWRQMADAEQGVATDLADYR
jgi:NAD(P)-dependent dehydrogenase (short-subunit alcohol dehydrogenase family)